MIKPDTITLNVNSSQKMSVGTKTLDVNSSQKMNVGCNGYYLTSNAGDIKISTRYRY